MNVAHFVPRDIVARAIDNEMKITGEDFVFLDCRHLDLEDFRSHFPNILSKCESLGIDIRKAMIPVVPAAHYICGGILVDEHGRSSIQNLYAAGECACTGLHGGEPIGIQLLLEALVYAHRSWLHAKEVIDGIRFEERVPDWNAEGTTQPNELVLITHNRRELQEVMSSYVGIVRSNVRLKRALDRLRILYGETEALYERTVLSPMLCELRNMITIGYLIVKAAMAKTGKRGASLYARLPSGESGDASMNRSLADQVFSIRNEQEFESVAMEVFRFQASENPVYREYLRQPSAIRPTFANCARYPSFHRLLPHPSRRDRSVAGRRTFRSSGTTGLSGSLHHVLDRKPMSDRFECFRLFYGDPKKYCILALLPSYLERNDSSLVYMTDHLIRASAHPDSGFFLNKFDHLHDSPAAVA